MHIEIVVESHKNMAFRRNHEQPHCAFDYFSFKLSLLDESNSVNDNKALNDNYAFILIRIIIKICMTKIC